MTKAETNSASVPLWRRLLARLALFMGEERDALPMRVFEVLFTLSFLMWMGHCFMAWEEWLTEAGIHLNAEELKAVGYPSPWPLLLGGAIFIL
jgi:hypothetical protein